MAETIEAKKKIVQKISRYIDDKAIVVPLFERRAMIYYNEKSVSSIGDQNGASTLFVERLAAK